MLTRNQKGFTLIELLIVISIIAFLASIVLYAFNSARAKARDVRRRADMRQISNALYLFYDKNGAMPQNYNPNGGACQGDGYYEQSMGELVTAGLLAKVPSDPRNVTDPNDWGYCYYVYDSSYTYGPGYEHPGALMVGALETAPESTTGEPPSCRPWAPSTNWCDRSSNGYYCICNPY